MQTITRKYYEHIKDKLLLYAKSIEIANRSGYQDANKDAENTFCFILNIIYDYQLENLNKIKNNFPGIDLGDDKNRISVQVTSENGKKKIQDTLDTFERKGYINTFDRLIILRIGENSKHHSKFNSGSLSFDPKKDIIGLTELMVEINKLSEEKLRTISEFIDHSILFETSEKENGSAFLTKQYKTVNALCYAKLKALGIKEDTAYTIIENGIAEFSYDFPDKVNYLIGEFGCGKSHTLYLYYLHLYNSYIKTTNPHIPVFLNVNLLSSFNSIQSWAQEQKIPLENCILIFDGLEEMAYGKIVDFMQELDFLSNFYPDFKCVISSRQMSILINKNIIPVKPLSLSEINTLFRQITGLDKYNIDFQLNDANKDAILKTLSKPFFTIIFSVYFEKNHYIKSELELMSIFIEKSITPYEDKYPNLRDALARLAILSLERNLGYIHKSEINPMIDCEQLLKSGYFFKDGFDNYAFSLPIIAQWFGADAIRKKYIGLEQMLASKENILKWRYSLSILFSQMTYEESREYFSKIVLKMPYIASIIIRDGVFCDYSISLPSTDTCGKRIYECMSIWLQAFKGIEFGLQEDGIHTNTLAYTQEDNIIIYSWANEYIGQDVIDFSKKEFCSSTGERAVPAQATWPWIVTFEELSRRLAYYVRYRKWILNDSILQQEALWKNKKTRISPYITADQKNNSKWIIGTYSKEQLLRRMQDTYSKALCTYKTFVETFLNSLKSQLSTYLILPCEFVGILQYICDENEKLTSYPRFSWYMKPLPISEPNQINICCKDEDEIWNNTAICDDLIMAQKTLRKDGNIFINNKIHNSDVKLSETPVTDIIYEWLENDLEEIGWL